MDEQATPQALIPVKWNCFYPVFQSSKSRSFPDLFICIYKIIVYIYQLFLK